MKKVRVVLYGALALVLAAAVSLLLVYRASQSVPDFYEQALVMEPAVAKLAGNELEQQILATQNQFAEGENWQLVVSDDQINGWLATDLNEKFPKMLPPEATQPRVKFQDGKAQIACRINTPKFSTILSIHIETYLTERPNEIAVRFHKVRAGSLPVPLTEMLDEITNSGHQAGIAVRWSQLDGDPVALVELPTQRRELRSGVLVQQLQIAEGELRIAGTADPGQPRVAESDDETFNRQR